MLAVALLLPIAGAGQQSSDRQNPDVVQDSAAPQPLDLSDEVVRDVFMPLQSSLNTSNRDHLLAVFDRDDMPDYAQLRDQFTALLAHYDSIMFRYRLLQVTEQQGHATAVIEADMEATPSSTATTPVRRSQQMRFTLKRTAKGWRILGFQPLDFFAL